ncbi:MAG: type sorting protein [Geminicoccaceae bacterium]|nr:type sorting protein [Geminicoccaceae bacterium]
MLRSGRVPGLTPALFIGVAALAACSDSATAPSTESAVHFPASVNKVVEGEEVCETIDFEGLTHSTIVTNQLSVFGSPLTVSQVFAFEQDGDEVATTARIYDGRTSTGPDDDLEWIGNAIPGLCDNCNTSILVIQDLRVETGSPPSDNAFGGRLDITGFPEGTYIKSFDLADHELTEANAQLIINGTTDVAPDMSAADGVNHILTFNTTSQPVITTGIRFVFGDPPEKQGSEGIDNIQVCKRIIRGEEGCTPGYWKNHEDSWTGTGFATNQTLESVFDVPDGLGLDNTTLHQALGFGGGPGTLGGAQILLRAAVAALLNASHPDVDYTMTTAEVIAAVNAALASNDRDTMLALAGALDEDNNLGCPIN